MTRNQDGTINMNGYLELTAKAPADAGARLRGSGQPSVSIPIQDRDTLKALSDILSLIQNAAEENKEEIVKQVITEVERIRLDGLTIDSAREISYLQQIEDKLRELSGKNVEIELGANAVQVTGIGGVLLSLPFATG